MIVDVLKSVVNQINVGPVLIFTAIVLLTWVYFKNRNLPPGPWGLPILGYVPFLDPKAPPEVQFQKLAKKYGNVVSIQLGSYLIVILNDFETIKEAYVRQGDVFAGRPNGEFTKVNAEDKGLFNTDGEIWREQRRFALSTLRDYGMGKLSLEPQMVEEIHFFLDELAKSKGNPVDLNFSLGMSTANVISMLEFGRRFDYTDDKFSKLRHLLDELVSQFDSIGARAIFKWLKNMQDHIREFLRKIVQDHEQDYNENSRKDYIDAFITERNETIKRTGTEGYFDMDEELLSTLQTLFGGGTETTTSTIRWACLFLMKYPEMQRKIQKEIDNVVGLERAPTMSDQRNMKYMEAFLLEVQRHGSIVPLNVPHSNLEETTLNGYRIPKRSIIFTNLWAVHHDPKLWDKPEEFRPERFINDKGNITKPEFLIPFGIGGIPISPDEGVTYWPEENHIMPKSLKKVMESQIRRICKRVCLGEALARMELFMYFSSLLQRFTILPPSGIPPQMDIESKIVRRPKPYKMLAVEREGYHVAY